jgi:hypothetical protein
LWPYGRVQSQSPGRQTISNYLAKYLSKSFHLREIYAEHGLKEHSRTYRFYLNLYDYEERAVQLVENKKLDAHTLQPLPPNQQVFRRYDYATEKTSCFYRTKEHLVGHCQKPQLIKKNYRLSTRTLNPLNLLPLATQGHKKELYQFKKPKRTAVSQDFQEFLLIRLLTLCQTAQFLHLPLEQDQVPKELTTCNQAITSHFKPKPLLHFTFHPQQAPLIRQFMEQLDTYAQEYEIEESVQFYTWPTYHDSAHQALLHDQAQKEKTITELNKSYKKLEGKFKQVKEELTKLSQESEDNKSVEQALDQLIKNINKLSQEIQ